MNHPLDHSDHRAQPILRPDAQRRSATRARSLFIAALMGLAACVGVSVTIPPSAASAATVPTMSVCVKTTVYQNGIKFSGKYVGPVFIDAYVNGSWHHVGSDSTSTFNGCVIAAVPVGYHWRFSVQYNSGRVWYAGASNHAYVTGNYSYNLGTFWV